MKIPTSARALLAELRARGVELSLERHIAVGPRGYVLQSRQIWAHGPVQFSDWEAVRRHRAQLLELLERGGAEDLCAVPPDVMAGRMLNPGALAQPRPERRTVAAQAATVH